MMRFLPVVFLLLLFGCQKQAPADLANGGPAPDFTGTTLDGETLRLSDLRGQPVVLNFWATWCAPCREETPDFVEMQREYGDDVRFVGVAVEEEAGPVREFVAEYGVNYPTVLDAESDIATPYGIYGFPTTLLLDAEGNVRKIWVGQVRPEELKPLVAQLRAG